MSYCCRALRGAITVEENTAEKIIPATRELLKQMIQANQIATEDLVSIIFTLTHDLNAVFPAEAARSLGWKDLPLLCCQEIAVPGSLPRCIRVLIHFNSKKKAEALKHVYLRKAVNLRPDLVYKNT